MVELDAGRLADAVATMDRRLAIAPLGENGPRFPIAYGRIMFSSGRAAEAIDTLRDNYGFWLSTKPESPYAAEALYWFGRAYQAVGDRRGDWMVKKARERLAKSPVATHRQLAAGHAVP